MSPRIRRALRILSVVAIAAVFAAPAAKAVRRWRLGQWRQQLMVTEKAIRNGDETVTVSSRPAIADDEGEEAREGDDPSGRRLADLAYHGVRGAAYQQHLAQVAAEESRRWAHLMPGKRGGLNSAAGVAGQSWVNIGPADARFEYNAGQYIANDTGRPNTILVDPRSAAVVYVATSGGGIWKTYDYGTVGGPHWLPITETIGNLAIGAMDLDRQSPDTIWVGLGDFADTSGGQVIRSLDGGATWSAPIQLQGDYPAGAKGSTPLAVAGKIRDIRVSPTDSNLVLVATDVALFRSTNATSATPTFTLVDLPNPNGATLQEAIWTFAYLGTANGKSQWLASGVQACDPGQVAPSGGGGVPAGATVCGGTTTCTLGNLGDIWKSTDSGANWTSLRGANALAGFTGAATEIGRIALGAGDPSNPANTVVYGEAGNADECNAGATAGIMKSTNGGTSWTAAATASTLPVNTSGDCADMNIAGGQSWYDLAISVDPGNSNQVITGGNLCGAITKDGGQTWINVANWLPTGGGGSTNSGTLPYVHADWHAATISRIGGNLVVFVGSDGGIFVSTNVFDATGSTAQNVVWTSLNKGLTTHLCYSIGSGDPVDGNAATVVSGLQDNGTRVRDSGGGNLSTTFNQVNGGDGFGATAASNAGASFILWSSVYSSQGHRIFCKASSATASNCNSGGAFSQSNPALPNGDAEPFITRFAPVQNDANSTVISATDHNIFKATYAPAWTKMTATSLTATVRGVVAAPQVYGTGGNAFRLYGAPLSGGVYAVIKDKSGTFTQTLSTTPQGTGTYSTDLTMFVRGTSTMTFPTNATNFGSSNTDGNVYVVGTVSPVLSDNVTPVPDSVGHIFLTTNGGASWTTLHGDGSGTNLPNVAIEVLRFDPSDTTDKTIYAGTDIGLYRTTDGGKTWARFGAGLPMVRVSDLFIAKNGTLLRASTYGRGLWEIYPTAGLPKGVDGDGDWDRNLQIDGFDLAALASRMGTTPATSAAPLYDYNVDLTGTTSTIDDSDLTALLAKFGSHP